MSFSACPMRGTGGFTPPSHISNVVTQIEAKPGFHDDPDTYTMKKARELIHQQLREGLKGGLSCKTIAKLRSESLNERENQGIEMQDLGRPQE